MNKILIISCICFFATSHSFCWGPTGHRTTGLIAHKHLNKKAKAKLEALLSGKPLPYFTTWMDEVRSDSNFKFMDDWHWVTIPQSQSYQQTEKNTKGDIIA